MRATEIGQILKVARERTGRNQSAVAAAADISPSMLSQIERGLVSPSIDTLFAVCASLDLDIAELFRRLSPAKPVRVVSAANRLCSEEDGIRYEQLVWSVSPGHAAEMFLLEIEKGRQAGISGHGHDGVELGSVLCGTATLTVDGTSYALREGDSVSFSSLLPHRLENSGRSVFRAIWTVLPPHRDYLDKEDKRA
jgi:transcriptional regulator with XRE-family HTH domain